MTDGGEKKSRRPNGAGWVGQVKRHDGKTVWRVVETFDHDPFTQKTIRIQGEGATIREAYERLEKNKLRRKIVRGDLTPEEIAEKLRPKEVRMTVKEWLDQWVEKQDWTPQNKINNGYRINNHIVGPGGIGDVKVRALTVEDCEKYFVRLRAKKNKKGERLLSENSLHLLYYLLKAAFDDATSKKIMLANPVLGIDNKPKLTRRSHDHLKPLRSWVPQQIFAAIEDDPLEALWASHFLGMRQSERLGITDEVVHLRASNAHIEIKQQLLRVPTGEEGNVSRLGVVPRTKTPSSKRDIMLVDPWLSLFKAHLEKQKKLRASLTPERRAYLKEMGWDTLLFTDETGKPINHIAERKLWKKVLERARVPQLRGHDSRHLTVSALSKLGYDAAAITRITGWSTQTMMAVYDHQTAEITGPALTELGKELTKRRRNGGAAQEG